MLATLGLPELIVDDLGAYETLALELARDQARLAGLRRRILEGREASPLFDAGRPCPPFRGGLPDHGRPLSRWCTAGRLRRAGCAALSPLRSGPA